MSSSGEGGTLLLVEQLGAVRRLTFNRPEKRNALSGPLFGAFLDELRHARTDLGTSVIVLRGAGPSFSSGWDLSDAVAGPYDLRRDRETLHATGVRMNEVFDCPLPIIAQVHGHCLAGAADLVLHCDLLLIARDALIGHPPVRSLGTPSTNMWLYRAGPQLAKRLLFTGDTISGQEAADRGLALSAHDPATLDGDVMELAERMARSSRDMLMSNKRVLNHGIELMGRSALLRYAQSEDTLAHMSPDAEAFRQEARDTGLSKAFRSRDSRFESGPGSR